MDPGWELAHDQANGSFRLSEVLGALSYALDITEGEPPGHAVRTCDRDADRRAARLDDDVRSALFYALLLKDAGCSGNASRLSSLFGADDQPAKAAMKRVDWSRSGSLALYTWRSIEPGGSPLAKVRRMRAITQEDEVTREAIGMRCERGAEIARMLELPEPTAAAIRALDEHWDGSGHPHGPARRGDPAARADPVPRAERRGVPRTMGARGAYGMALKRRGRWFDPALVDALLAFRDDAAFWGPLEDPRVPAAGWEPRRPRAVRRRRAARPRRRGVRARDRREVALHGPPLGRRRRYASAIGAQMGLDAGRAARPPPRRAAARHRQARRSPTASSTSRAG